MLTLLKRFLYTLPLVFIGWLGSMPGHAAESSAVAITAGYFHTCVLTTAGGVKCWGTNGSGQLGDNTNTFLRRTPVDVVGLASGVAAISAGTNHTCALTTAGGVKCWGYNASGQLGDNTTTDRLTPVDVVGLVSGVAAIAAGSDYTCALTTAGGVKCWGSDGGGGSGGNTPSSNRALADVTGLTSGVLAIAAGDGHTCALTTAGGVKCWGHFLTGEIGINTATSSSLPIDMGGFAASGVAAIFASYGHTCVVTTAGGAKCWSGNDVLMKPHKGQYIGLNIGIIAASGVAAIATGQRHACTLSRAGVVKCWGYNESGQLGDNTHVTRYGPPVDVVGLASGVLGIAAGQYHTCAITKTGGVMCWGQAGYLGDNTTTWRSLTPVNVVGLGSGVPVVPNAPTINSVTIGNGYPVVSFTAPVNMGSSPVSFYTATISPSSLTHSLGSDNGYCTAPCSSITFNGLIPYPFMVGSTYSFTVTATNAAGVSAPSAALNITRTLGIDHAPLVQRAFVASNGLDTNIAFNCDITHPCLTFSTAVAVVKADGEVVAVNSAAYGPVTLTRSISLVAAPGIYAGATGVTIATPGVNVVLRGLTINSGRGNWGVVMSAGAKLSIENCVISNFKGSLHAGVFVYTAATVRVVDTIVRDNEIGMQFLGGATANISKSKLFGNKTGILVQSAAGMTSPVAVSNSVIAGGGTGINVLSTTSGNVQINIVRSVVTNNTVKGIVASATAGTASVTLNKSLVAGNAIGFYKGTGGTLNSLGNNTITDNGSNTGTLTSITPK